ncbi:DUF6328 family protein [Massilia sp. CF038]|uniref:DUF6328 family protein n=1 Tax=Massilia sp. CF038 TaxID=1881045 RepID=UPI00091648EB|nr:DUF6328 family protein [Massilia sp. CF038]SHH73616.1 hypothetical protein SAMN05428948_5177 [Massilia sp. CF038]
MENNLNEQNEQNGFREEMRNIIEEARVILPGVQALFGFQTIAVFNDRFADLPSFATLCHLIGLGMVIVAVALVMTPAVYYRVVGPKYVSHRMVKRSSWMIRSALAPLALGLALDMFTVIYVATDRVSASIAGALLTFAFLSFLWFVFPWTERRQQRQNQV